MTLAIAFAVLAYDLVDAPKRPYIRDYWRVIELRNANEMLIRSIFDNEGRDWIRLYGVDVPFAGQKGYSGARQDLELLLGREPDVYFEDEKKDHPISRNSSYVRYVWAYGKLLQFEMVRDGWAKVNEEGRKGRYAKYLIGAEEEAKKFKSGIWAH